MRVEFENYSGAANEREIVKSAILTQSDELVRKIYPRLSSLIPELPREKYENREEVRALLSDAADEFLDELGVLLEEGRPHQIHVELIQEPTQVYALAKRPDAIGETILVTFQLSVIQDLRTRRAGLGYFINLP